MKEFEIVMDQTFSGQYPLELEKEPFRLARIVIADVRVSRPPLNSYFSKKTFPAESFYGTILLMSAGLVMQRLDIQYEEQRFIVPVMGDRQDIPMQICILEEEVSNLVAAVSALGGSLAVSNTQYFEDLVPMPFLIDALNFCCYADTALNCQLQLLEYESCKDQQEDEPPPPQPRPPNPLRVFPPGQPIPPDFYADLPKENPQDSIPFPGDNEGGEPPVEPNCSPFRVTYTVFFASSLSSEPIAGEVQTQGEPSGTYKKLAANGNGFEVGLLVSNLVEDVCVGGIESAVFTGGGPDIELVIDSSVPL